MYVSHFPYKMLTTNAMVYLRRISEPSSRQVRSRYRPICAPFPRTVQLLASAAMGRTQMSVTLRPNGVSTRDLVRCCSHAAYGCAKRRRVCMLGSRGLQTRNGPAGIGALSDHPGSRKHLLRNEALSGWNRTLSARSLKVRMPDRLLPGLHLLFFSSVVVSRHFLSHSSPLICFVLFSRHGYRSQRLITCTYHLRLAGFHRASCEVSCGPTPRSVSLPLSVKLAPSRPVTTATRNPRPSSRSAPAPQGAMQATNRSRDASL
jgi:hypothetical protein